MELPVRNSHSEFGVFAPYTDDKAYPRNVFSLRESINGVTGILVLSSPTTFKSAYDSLIIAIMVGFCTSACE